MNVKERMKVFKEFSEKQAEILLGKGHDYTAGKADVDANANFKIIAELLDGAKMTPYTVAMVYFLKHVLSLITYCKTGKQESGESLEGRHLDIANYSFILKTILDEVQS